MTNSAWMSHLEEATFKQFSHIEDFFKFVILDNDLKELAAQFESYSIHNFNGFSGWNFWSKGVLHAQIHLATLVAGGFVLYLRFYQENNIKECYRYYNIEGEFVFESKTLEGSPINYNSINMDPSNPFINHLYNILHSEYNYTYTGFGRTRLIASIERMLQSFANNDFPMSARKPLQDLAYQVIYREKQKTERENVLTYQERKAINHNLSDVKSKIIKTKKRAHRFNWISYNFLLRIINIKQNFSLFFIRPQDNLTWLMHDLTIGKLIWFFKTVRSNLGLSVAMAIYTPFTFYFITQPMNPHAMQVVGEIRDIFLRTTGKLKNELTSEAPKEMIVEAKKTLKSSPLENNFQDEVSLTQSTTKEVPIHLNDLPHNPLKFSWNERMSAFKEMQITYESNLEFSARMGRIEQMEEQYSFSLTAQAAWSELSFYQNEITNILKWNNNLSSKYTQFLDSELKRIALLKEYSWRRLGQFFLDHPYIVVDQDDQQKMKDHYTQIGFILFKKMTADLAKDEKAFAQSTHPHVIKMSKTLEDSKTLSSTILEELQNNSKTFEFTSTYDAESLRDKIKRQWEVIFLQQNKTQEASTFALQMYNWSARNTMWLIQSIYSLKRAELSQLTYKYNLNNANTTAVKADAEISSNYASLLNFLLVEFTSFSKELKTLKNDHEYEMRKRIVHAIKQSLIERDRLFGINRGIAQK